MAEFKVVLGLKNGKTVQKVVKDTEASALLGVKIGDKVDGSKIGFAGYELELCGGSDYCGFPMRKDVQGTGRKRILITKSVGMRENVRGMRKRKTVCGNTVHAKITQVNLKVLKEGKVKLVEQPKEESAPKVEKKEDAKPKVAAKAKKPKDVKKPGRAAPKKVAAKKPKDVQIEKKTTAAPKKPAIKTAEPESKQGKPAAPKEKPTEAK